MSFVHADADLLTERITLRSEWLHKDMIKAIPGSRWDSKERQWAVPLSWAACVALRGSFGPNLKIGQELHTWAAAERQNRVDPANQARGALELLDDGDPDTKEILSWRGTGPRDLFPHQEAGTQFLIRAGRALLADEMGTGKSCNILSALRVLDAIGSSPFPALVVCPNSVKRHWVAEVGLFLPVGAKVFVLAGSLNQRRKLLDEAKEHPKAIVVVNIEGVRSLSRLAPYGSIKLVKCVECDKLEGDPNLAVARCETHVKELNTFGFRTCVLDEAHRVKDPEAKQTRAIWSVFHGPTVQNAWALTGTPIADNVGDLWSIMHAVAPHEYQTRSKYIERYAMINYNAFGMEIVGLNPTTRSELFSFLDPRFRRVTKDVVLKHLPPKLRTTRPVEMSPKQKKAYDGLESAAMTELESGALLTAPDNLVLRTRLLQLSSSYCDIAVGEDPLDYRTWTVTPKEPSPKVDELIEIIRELNGAPVAVAAEHRRLLELASARLEKEGIPHVMITGSVPEHQRATNLAEFQSGQVGVVLFTFKAGGVGLNMTRAGTLVRLQRSDSMIDNKQGEDRVHRIGSEIHTSVNIIDVVSEGTVEELQIERLNAKLARLEEINRDRAARQAAGLDAHDLNNEESALLHERTL